MLRQLDGILFINLDHRADRRASIMHELALMDLEAERFEAVSRPHLPSLGCAESHLAALKLAKERGWDHTLVLEDDFVFLVDKPALEAQMRRLFDGSLEWDVCMLAYSLQASEGIEPGVLRVLEAQTASAYVVRRSYLDELIALYEEAVPLLAQTARHWDFANDQVWKRLQRRDRWIAFEPRLGRQAAGYSDNSRSFCDHGC